MNFDYMRKASPNTEDLKALYESLYLDLEAAEQLYWSEPQQCGVLLRGAAVKICRIYNCFYELEFPEEALLEDYLCYTSEEGHNMMVSRFLSVVRADQRDYLEWIRVWGDECIFMSKHPDELQKNQDKLYLNVKKMMIRMLDVTRELCKKLDHMEDLDELVFKDTILPGYQSEEEKKIQELQVKREHKKGRFPFFRK